MFEREAPRRRVVLDGFYMDRFEVTNALFKRFVVATGYRTTAEQGGFGWVWQRKDSGWQAVKIDGAWWDNPNGPGSVAPAIPVAQGAGRRRRVAWAGKRLPTERSGIGSQRLDGALSVGEDGDRGRRRDAILR